ncbi:MAG TPA: hypothetical protein V6D47_08585 [Oscillatoriaceae cyanobacterium]
MITVPVTALVTAILALFGVKPTPWLIGGVLIVVKVLVALGVFKLFSGSFKRKPKLQPAPQPDTEPQASTEEA